MKQYKEEMRNSIEQLTDKGHNVAVKAEYADMDREVISELNIEYKKQLQATCVTLQEELKKQRELNKSLKRKLNRK